MTERIDPASGNILAHPAGPTLSPSQRLLAAHPNGWHLARCIHHFTNSPAGGPWFSQRALNMTPRDFQTATEGAKLGLWAKVEAKAYWRHTSLTWPWVMTAMALEEEWQRGEEAARLRLAIDPSVTLLEMNRPTTQRLSDGP